MIQQRLTIALLITTLGLTLPAAADEESIIKYRQNAMKAASAHLKSAGLILKGEVPFQDDLGKHAKALADLGPIIAAGFPEGSDFGETDAKEAVWEEREKFDKAADAFVKASAAFAAAPSDETLGAVGKSCKGCHKPFREK